MISLVPFEELREGLRVIVVNKNLRKYREFGRDWCKNYEVEGLYL